MRFATTLAAGALLGAIGLGSVSASAAPVVPQAGLLAADMVETVRYRHHHHYGTTKRERMMRRKNTRRYGNPNARNPSRSGYQQQLGNTTNGPRY